MGNGSKAAPERCRALHFRSSFSVLGFQFTGLRAQLGNREQGTGNGKWFQTPRGDHPHGKSGSLAATFVLKCPALFWASGLTLPGDRPILLRTIGTSLGRRTG